MSHVDKSILVTGGAGYIGSHVVCELLLQGWSVVVFDNYSNSDETNLDCIRRAIPQTDLLRVYEGDIRDPVRLRHVFSQHRLEGVIHLAGLKSVGESVRDPLRYYENNVMGCGNLLRIMKEYKVFKLIFSSSATVYGDPQVLPLTEKHPTQPTNPYGTSKRMCEQIIEDVCKSHKDFRAIILRYFNPVGSHPTLPIAERPRGTPTNLMPYMVGVVKGRYPHLNILGVDYPTPDGTAIRDYIHVVDLARGHLQAWKSLQNSLDSHMSCRVYNLGTGTGVSVMEMVKAMRAVSHHPLKTIVQDRREGDISVSYADSSLAEAELNWRPSYSLADMCRDSLKI
jgi:UDP-glucose 4-epimerase